MCLVSVLRHIGVLSTARIVALLGLVIGLVYGILIAVFAAAYAGVTPGLSGMGGLGAGGVPVMIIVFTVIGGAIGGFIYGAVIAFLYNAFAGWVGGIELDLA